MKWLFIWLIRFYQRAISPLKRRPTCRFTPSCSAYGLEAFTKRGFFVGLYLTVRRILRCNPFHPGGYDPVPERAVREKRQKKLTQRNDSPPDLPPRVCEDYLARRDHHTKGADLASEDPRDTERD